MNFECNINLFSIDPLQSCIVLNPVQYYAFFLLNAIYCIIIIYCIIYQ